MKQEQIKQQARESLKTYFKEDNQNLKANDQPLGKEEITNIVKEEIQAKKQKIASLEVLRKNIAIKAEASLEKVMPVKKLHQ